MAVLWVDRGANISLTLMSTQADFENTFIEVFTRGIHLASVDISYLTSIQPILAGFPRDPTHK